ncbi:MAG: ankyrin repeat domain-containing protein, partial [Proteobacteria bacterium]|nr:ankyrin repeat domain-containing protein [Pseudomonadota bacterium]
MAELNMRIKGDKLTDSIKSNASTEVTAALANGVDPNCRDKLGNSALHVAIQYGRLEIAACLLSYGA